MANFWGEEKFAHPACATPSILKTAEHRNEDGTVDVEVRAYGYMAEPRIDYVSKYCRNGNYYDVPVHWNEYIPVTGTGTFEMMEDVDDDAPDMDPLSRLHATEQKMQSFGDSSIFRRYITSRMKSAN